MEGNFLAAMIPNEGKGQPGHPAYTSQVFWVYKEVADQATRRSENNASPSARVDGDTRTGDCHTSIFFFVS
jgi:hypothetical protein